MLGSRVRAPEGAQKIKANLVQVTGLAFIRIWNRGGDDAIKVCNLPGNTEEAVLISSKG